MPVAIRTRLALDRHGIQRKDRLCMKQRAGMLATVEAMAKPDAIGLTSRNKPYIAAEASAAKPVHGLLAAISNV